RLDALMAAGEGIEDSGPADDRGLIEEDLQRVAHLARPAAGHAPVLNHAQAVLVTGATGFIGRYLLRALLASSVATITCLVRAASADSARARVLSALREIMSADDLAAQAHRLICLPGDLAEDGLGLAPETRERLARDIDLIVHNGALPNMVLPYPMLRKANTLSVLPLLDLMTRGRAKTMHFVSTLAVVPDERAPVALPSTAFMPPIALESGYSLSKWVAERLLEDARGRGFDIRIHRPGAVIGDSITGYYPALDATNCFLHLCHDVHAIPEQVEHVLSSLVCVDEAADQMLAVLEAPAGDTHLCHVVSRAAISALELRNGFAQAGRMVEIVSALDWAARVFAMLEQRPDHPAGWLLPSIQERDPLDFALAPQDGPHAPCAGEAEDFSERLGRSLAWLSTVWDASTQTGTQEPKE
ncbi:MAG: NAD-dependent epimerase/dehydratase family protein, partial [Rhodobacteraceae bacterium]